MTRTLHGLATEDGYSVVLIDDGGPGIPPELRDAAFEPFRRLSAAGNGVGLGLAIVRRVVKRHRGTVRIETSPAGGTRLRIELPASKDPPS